MNSDQLRSILLRHLMETKVPAHEDNFMGFGKYSQWTYGQTAVHAPSYSAWTVEKATSESECHWRLRYAVWYQGLSRSDKLRLENITSGSEKQGGQSSRRGYPQIPSASSTGPMSTTLELGCRASLRELAGGPYQGVGGGGGVEADPGHDDQLLRQQADRQEPGQEEAEPKDDAVKTTAEVSDSESDTEGDHVQPGMQCRLPFSVAKQIGSCYEEAMVARLKELCGSRLRVLEIGGSEPGGLVSECEKQFGKGSAMWLSDWNGGDLDSQSGQESVLRTIQENMPQCIWSRPDTTPFSPLRMMNQKALNRLRGFRPNRPKPLCSMRASLE